MDRDIQKKKKKNTSEKQCARAGITRNKRKKRQQNTNKDSIFTVQTNTSRGLPGRGLMNKGESGAFQLFFFFFLASYLAFNRQPWEGGGGVEC